MSYWCAQTEGNREAVAERFLQMTAYSVYYPRILERNRVRPLFPSYIFIAAALQWHKARWTVGVVRIVAGSGGEPGVIGDYIVDAIRQLRKAAWSCFLSRRVYARVIRSALPVAFLRVSWASMPASVATSAWRCCSRRWGG